MAVSAPEFWQQLTRIGIVDSATCIAWMKRFKAVVAKRAAVSAAKTDHSPATDSVAVAQFLIAKGVITKFQSQRLLAGRAGELRIGDYLVLDRCDCAPMTRWCRGRHLGASTECFLYPCSDALTSSRWVDLTWLRAHESVSIAGLQPIKILTLVASDPWRGAIVSDLPAGRSLDQWAASQQPLEHVTIASIGLRIANSLAAMHASGLVHGEVRPSRVWCGEDRSVLLLRDAGRPPARPDDSPQEHRWFDDDTMADLYAAPELARVGAEATTGSDLFSLGALLYCLATGQTVRQRGESFQVPPTVVAANNAGASGDPLLRTIAYAIDPDPAARFPDVEGFAKALNAVISAYEAIQPPRLQPVVEPMIHDVESVSGGPDAEPMATVTPVPPVPVPPVPVPPVPAPPVSVPIAEPAETVVMRSPVAKDMKPKSQVRPFGLPASEPSESKPRTTLQSQTPQPQIDQPQPPQPKPRTQAPPQAQLPPSPSPPLVTATVNSPEPITASKPAQIPVSSASLVPASPSAPTAPTAAKRAMRKRTRRTRRGPIVIGTIAVVILLGVFVVFLRPATEAPSPRLRPSLSPPPPAVSTTATPTVKPPTVPTKSTSDTPQASPTDPVGFELVEDDRLLWAPPWSPGSKPPSLGMIPPGSQLIVSLRMGRLIGDATSSPWLDWMEPEITPALADIEKRSGLKGAQIDRLIIASSAASSGLRVSTYTVTPRDPVPLKSLMETWGVSPSRTKEGKAIYSGDEPTGDAYFVKENDSSETATVQSFVFGPVDLIAIVADNEGEPIPLPRALQQLWDTASEEADFIAMTVPNFLFADGRDILKTYAPNVIEPLRSLLIPDIAGAIISMSLVDTWYVETRVTPSGSVSAPAVLQAIQPRITALPAWAESFTVDVNVESSWRAIANRLPQFMRAIADQTRLGVSKSVPTANFYLPIEAAPQVSLATILALSMPEVSPVVVVADSAPMAPMTVEQMLDAPLSVSFDQESLEFASVVIHDEFARSLPAGSLPPTITIIGGDLEKLGITQNQQIRNFQIRDKALRDALSELVRQANPDKSATGLTDLKQSLVWVVDTSAATPTIQITTRPAAIAKDLKLPKEFTDDSVK